MTNPELLAAVLGNADVAWAVSEASRTKVRVAGPWAPWTNSADHTSSRWFANRPRSPAASASRCVDGRWGAYVGNDCAYFDTQPEAESWCDDQLRAAGVLLAGVMA